MVYKHELAWLRVMAMLNKTIELYEQGNYQEIIDKHEDIKAAYTQVKAIRATMKNIEKELGI